MTTLDAGELAEVQLRPELGDEAGDYVEDEPATWLAVVKAMRRYGEHFAPLTANLGDPDGAAEVLAGAMLGYLAATHSVFVRFEDPVAAARKPLIGQYPEGYERAGEWTALLVYEPQYYGNGPTPAAALRALAEALRMAASASCQAASESR